MVKGKFHNIHRRE